MINERENAVLLSAGFTQREINTQRQKFYNLFRIEPYLNPMRKVGEWVDLTDEDVMGLCRTFMGQFDKTKFIKATEAKLKEKNNV